MCWIAVIPEGKQVTESEFRNAFTSNRDGAGFMYVKDGQLTIEKGFFKFEDFYEAYKKLNDDLVRVVHFRAGTGGAHNEVNCHPFQVNRYLAFAHNGVFGKMPHDTEHSDTWNFNEIILKPLFKGGYKLLHSGNIQWFLRESTGHNKLAFLTIEGKAVIIGESLGHWSGGIWFSGYSHNNYSRSYSSGGTTRATTPSTQKGPYGPNSSYSPSGRSPAWEAEFDGMGIPEDDTIDAEVSEELEIDLGNTTISYAKWIRRQFDKYMGTAKDAPDDDTPESQEQEARQSMQEALAQFAGEGGGFRMDAVGE